MKCKFCQAELEDNSSVCPSCGKDNLKDDLKVLKIVALSLVCVVMLVLLAGLVHYGVTGSFLPDWIGGSDSTEPTDGKEATKIYIQTKDGKVEVDADTLAAYMDDVVVTMGEHTMTNGDLQLYYWMVAYNESDVDTEKPLTEQIYDEETGKTWHDYCLEQAVDAWREVTLMTVAAEEAGFALSSEYLGYLEGMKAELENYVMMYQYYGYNISTVDELIQMMYGPGSNYEAYYRYVYATYYGGMYWAEMLEDLEVTDGQIEDYFTEHEEELKTEYNLPITKDFGNMVDVRNIMIAVITTKDPKGNTVEDWEGTLAKAQAVYDQWLAGEMTEEAFIALVKEHSEDEVSGANDGLYSDMYKGCLAEVDVRHILIMPEDEEDEASWTAAETAAQEILDQWLTDPTEEYFAELANEHSDDNNGNVTNGGIYTDVYLGQMVKAFEEWCFDASRQSGDYGIVKTEYGYHIMYFVRVDNEADNWAFDESRVAGDVALLACDDGYQIIYVVDSEPAWYRYCRYGVQSDLAQDVLDEMMEETAFSLDTDAVALASY